MLTCCATWVVLIDQPEPISAQLFCIVWGSQGKQCTVALLTRCLWFPSAAATQRATTKKKLHLSVLHIKTWLLLPLYSAGFLNTTDHVHITTSSFLLTDMFFINIIIEDWHPCTVWIATLGTETEQSPSCLCVVECRPHVLWPALGQCKVYGPGLMWWKHHDLASVYSAFHSGQFQSAHKTHSQTSLEG